MSDRRAFAPLYQGTLAGVQAGLLASTTVTPNNSTATASTTFTGEQGRNDREQMRICNTTTSWAYVEFGNIALGACRAATVASSLPVAPGAVEIISVSGGVNCCSVILGAATTGGTTVIFTRGEGL